MDTTILLIGPGLDDGTRTAKLAEHLAGRFRVLTMRRRQYRPELKPGNAPCSIAEEVEDVLELVKDVEGPLVVYGHSSGGIVALEALVAAPSRFTAAVIYEAPVVLGPPLGGEALTRARAALAEGKPGRALAIFMRDTVGLPGWQAWLIGKVVALAPQYRALVPHQIDDLEAIDRLGARLDEYSRVAVPTLLVGGDRSPAHLAQRLDALERALPRADRLVLHKQGHSADVKVPARLAEAISAFVDKAR
ncbi:alpha/beta hydrolase [Allokutzneria multivorans]|uniref:Alpha/beta hydrolase n=1 Tax=Allokutzneria multivorans TaxID=1142134 RepID=A0ABP7RFE9_9PSEU